MLVVNPRYEQVTEQWFEPGYWGSRALPVAAGGRGSAWFICSGQGELVLRHYRRGGLMARFSERNYLFTGMSRTRSFREFRLLEILFEQGLPVPEPVAAWSGKSRGLYYHSGILITRIADAVPIPEVDDINSLPLWLRVGETIRRFHDQGLDHVDLNCDNILVTSGGIHLIDFDRCRLHERGIKARWKQRNLDRLRRSVDKRLHSVTEKQRNALWQALLAGYDKHPSYAVPLNNV